LSTLFLFTTWQLSQNLEDIYQETLWYSRIIPSSTNDSFIISVIRLY